MSRMRGPVVMAFVLMVTAFYLVADRTIGVPIAAILAGAALWQLRVRAVARARVDDGVWRMHGWLGSWLLIGAGGRGSSLLGPPRLDLVPTPSGLVCRPSRWGRRAGYEERTLPWDEIVSVREQDIGRTTPDGRFSLTRQTAVVVALLDRWVFDDDGTRESEAEMREAVEGLTDGTGGPVPLGTETALLTTDAPEGLADAIRRHARGAQRLGLTGGD